MKIAFAGPVAPYRGGIAHFAARLATEMSLQDECYFFNFSRLYPNLLFPGKTQYDTSSTEVAFPSERLIDSINPISWHQATRRLLDWKPEAVIYHYWHPFFIPAYSYLIRASAKVTKSIIICHNIAPHEGEGLQKILTKRFFNRASGFIVHASSEAADLLEMKPSANYRTAFHPLYDIFPGQDLSREEARAKLGIAASEKLALYFGLIRPYKGVDLFLEAGKHLLDIPDLKLLAVGEVYSGDKQYAALAASFPEERASLIDRYVPNEEVSLYFRAADIVVLPYRSATQSGVVPIAYACDRPVIVTNVGGLPDVVEEGITGYIVPPEDPKALANAIRKFFCEPDRDRFSSGIDAARKRLSWSNYVNLLRNLINEVKIK